MRQHHEAMATAVPDGLIGRVARTMSVAPSALADSRHSPDHNRDQYGSPRKFCIERTCDLIDALLLHHPPGALVIRDHLSDHYGHRVGTMATLCPNVHRLASAVIQEAVDAGNALHSGAGLDVVELELTESIAVAQKALQHVRAMRVTGGAR